MYSGKHALDRPSKDTDRQYSGNLNKHRQFEVISAMTENIEKRKAFLRKGYSKNGTPLPVQTMPKQRLSAKEVKVLRLLNDGDKSMTMLETLKVAKKTYKDDHFTEALMSQHLKELKAAGFLESTVTRPSMLSRPEKAFTTKKKAVFCLSQKAKTGTLAVDSNRWVMVNGVYVAPFTLRQKTEQRESKRQAKS